MRECGIALCVGLLSACSTSTMSVKLLTDPEANNNSPLNVSIVYVYDDKKLLAQMKGLPAQQWFLTKQQLLSDNPDGLAAVTWQVIPNQSLVLQKVSYKTSKLIGVLVYAGYFGPGAHRAVLGEYQNLTILLNPKDLMVKNGS
ncbi:MAG: hypothetical protein A3J38_08560 [Gammaproteobacteria bacterium RIFCSPHIGHO2_12_FULL_45_9]|nr:MAG: hypothetical protein A3J38_08560 [Gammaproteobacteria bacterium RIFCSPHIGHO2_12_FULL_45_9]